jgi:hypothetical protein
MPKRANCQAELIDLWHCGVFVHNPKGENMSVQEFIEILKKRLDRQTTWTRHEFYDQLNLAFYDYQKLIEARESDTEVFYPGKGDPRG